MTCFQIPYRLPVLMLFLCMLTAMGLHNVHGMEKGTAIVEHQPKYLAFRQLFYLIMIAIVGANRARVNENTAWHKNIFPYFVKGIDIVVNLFYEKAIFYFAELATHFWIKPILHHCNVIKKPMKILTWTLAIMATLTIGLMGAYTKMVLHMDWLNWTKGISSVIMFFGLLHFYFSAEEYGEKQKTH